MRSKNDWLDYLEHRMAVNNYLCHYGVLGMHWGIRKDRYSSSRTIRNNAIKHEPKITSDVQDSVLGNHASLYGLENRFKTKKSITRKKKSKEVNDALRYTAILSDKNFVKQYEGIKAALVKKGYTETKCKNYFQDYREGKVNHKSVQTNYQTNDGYVFEIQFQTKASQKAKDKKVSLYEEARNPKTSAARINELNSQMRILAETVTDPPGISRIKSH